jgi:hypothetical protein
MKKVLVLDGYNNRLGGGDEIGTIVPQNCRWGITNGYKLIEVYRQREKGEDGEDNAHIESNA